MEGKKDIDDTSEVSILNSSWDEFFGPDEILGRGSRKEA